MKRFERNGWSDGQGGGRRTVPQLSQCNSIGRTGTGDERTWWGPTKDRNSQFGRVHQVDHVSAQAHHLHLRLQFISPLCALCLWWLSFHYYYFCFYKMLLFVHINKSSSDHYGCEWLWALLMFLMISASFTAEQIKAGWAAWTCCAGETVTINTLWSFCCAVPQIFC